MANMNGYKSGSSGNTSSSTTTKKKDDNKQSVSSSKVPVTNNPILNTSQSQAAAAAERSTKQNAVLTGQPVNSSVYAPASAALADKTKGNDKTVLTNVGNNGKEVTTSAKNPVKPVYNTNTEYANSNAEKSETSDKKSTKKASDSEDVSIPYKYQTNTWVSNDFVEPIEDDDIKLASLYYSIAQSQKNPVGMAIASATANQARESKYGYRLSEDGYFEIIDPAKYATALSNKEIGDAKRDYEWAKFNNDQAGMDAAHQKAMNARARIGLTSNEDGTGETIGNQEVYDKTHQSNIKFMEKGNIDTSKLPTVQREDGAVGTVDSKVFVIDDGVILLPRIINGERVSDADALKHYRETGQHLGRFYDRETANAYKKELDTAEMTRLGLIDKYNQMHDNQSTTSRLQMLLNLLSRDDINTMPLNELLTSYNSNSANKAWRY